MKNEERERVINIEEDSEVSRRARKNAFSRNCIILSLAIICGTVGYATITSNKKESTNDDAYNTTQEQLFEKTSTVEEIPSQVEDVQTQVEDVTSPISEEEYTVEYANNGREIDYSNVDAFFNSILNYRNTYGEFAECFQDKSDVINLINFIYLFDLRYEVESPINSQEEFDEIIRSYYSSCLKYNIKPDLSVLFDKNTTFGKLLAESEDLVYKLKDSKNNDYTDENNYYIWIENNFVNDETAISQSIKNSVLVDLEREIFGVYYNEGDMYAAAKNQKNDYYQVEQRDVYYYSTNDEATETEYDSYMCPNTVREVFGKFDTKNSDKWISNNGSYPYQKVDDAFTTILNKERAR